MDLCLREGEKSLHLHGLADHEQARTLDLIDPLDYTFRMLPPQLPIPLSSSFMRWWTLEAKRFEMVIY